MRSNNFDVNVPVTMCTEVESQANNCENKALLWKNFKNSFTWLTSMKKFIFDLSTFLDPASFRSLRSKKWIKNWPEPKSHKFQKLLFSCLLTMWKKFENWFTCGIVFCLSFYLNAHCDRDVNLKIIWPHKFVLTWST